MSRLRSASVVSLALALSTPAFAADAGSPTGPTGTRGDVSMVLKFVEKQTVSLEQAMPQKKFTWRPGKGVRSVSEVYLHIAGGIYFLLGKGGYETPADVSAVMQSKKWESQTTNKDEIKKILTTAFAFAQKTIADTSDADLEKTLDFFGTQMTERALFIGLVSHCSEHLGQSIAYARTNGVVPPWSKPGASD
jgi:uncharacterized damage-inducible protein DinB